MQAAKYWRNRSLRYRLERALPRRVQALEMPRLLRTDPKPAPKPKLTRAS